MILTEIGEIGIHAGGRTHLLRPSLHAMSQLGTPAEIVSVFVSVMGRVSDDHARRLQLQDALGVIFACAGDDDLSGLFGALEPRKNGSGLVYRPGAAPVSVILPLARALLRHGIVGALPPERNGKEGEYSQEFNARDLVALAIAHLGMNEREAWGLTMTSLMSAMRAKFPPQESSAPGVKAPTKDQHTATMQWFEKVSARRRTLH